MISNNKGRAAIFFRGGGLCETVRKRLRKRELGMRYPWAMCTGMFTVLVGSGLRYLQSRTCHNPPPQIPLICPPSEIFKANDFSFPSTNSSLEHGWSRDLDVAVRCCFPLSRPEGNGKSGLLDLVTEAGATEFLGRARL